MKIGDMVRVRTGLGIYEDDDDTPCIWPEAVGAVGMIIAHAMRLHIPAVEVMILGEIAQFDLNELEVIR